MDIPLVDAVERVNSALTYGQAMAALGCSRQTVWRLVRSGQLTAYRIGSSDAMGRGTTLVIDPDSVAALVEARSR